MAFDVRNIISIDVNNTIRILLEILKLSKDYDFRVAPLDDDLVGKIGVWVEGSTSDIDGILAKLDKLKIDFIAIPYITRRRSYVKPQ